MFELLLLLTAAVVIAGMIVAFDGSRDAFHPLMFIGPMLLFQYAWMPFTLQRADGLSHFFDNDQLLKVQTLNLLGVTAFVLGSLFVGVRLRSADAGEPAPDSTQTEPMLPSRVCRRLLLASAILGTTGFICWAITIIQVGGFVNAFSTSYSGGWNDSGYIRDGVMLLLVGVLLALTSLANRGPRVMSLLLSIGFALPWAASAALMGRRGPTFGLAVIVLMGWYFARGKRPPVLAMAIAGVCLGWLVLFLVTNRQSIYLGSSFEVTTDVSDIVSKPQTGNEYIYGAGTVLSSERRDHYFWMRRYLAQILVRPIPSAIWPTKYEDFGVPELLFNAGTGEGFGDALGWVGAVGSAPGIVADLWLEVWWFAVPFMAVLGWCYAAVWKRAVLRGQPWASVYIVLAALSIYLIMQTMEAVIFRTLELAIPCWLAWQWALKPRRDPFNNSTSAHNRELSQYEVTQHA